MWTIADNSLYAGEMVLHTSILSLSLHKIQSLIDRYDLPKRLVMDAWKSRNQNKVFFGQGIEQH